MSAPRHVFIGGLHGSGTSLLHRLLRAQPGVSGFADTGVPEDEGQHLQAALPTARSLGGLGRFGYVDGAHLTEASELAGPETRERLLSSWEPHWDSSSPVRVEKSPPNLLRFRLLQSLFPEAVCVAVLRHPLSVAYSTRAKRKLNRLRSVERLVDHWIHCHRLFRADQGSLDRLHVIRYEALVQDPEGCLASLMDALDLPGFQPGEPLDGGRDDAHRRSWRARMRRPPRPSKVLAREDEVSSWGYSLLDFARDLR